MAKDNKHLAAFRERHLKGSESVVASAEGYIGDAMGRKDNAQHNGALVVTNERAAFYRKGFLGEVLETMELKKITSIERKSMLGHRSIRLHTSHDELEFKTFDKDGEARLIDAIEAGRSSDQPAEPSQNAQADDPINAIERLAALKEKGLLTDDEFQKQKEGLLAKM